jgi:hypothetical protein
MAHFNYKNSLSKWKVNLHLKDLKLIGSSEMSERIISISDSKEGFFCSFTVVYNDKEFKIDLPIEEVYNRLVKRKFRSQLLKYDKERGIIKQKPKSKARKCPDCGNKMILSEDKPDGLHFYCSVCEKNRKLTWE